MNTGTAPIPYRQGDLVSRLTHSFSNNFSGIAIDAGGEEISYSQLEFWIQDIIRYLGPDLPDEGSRIVVLSDDPIDYVPAMLDAFRLGAIYVTMDPKAPKQRLTQLLAEVNPTVVLCGSMEKEVDILKGYFTRRLPPYTGKLSTQDHLNTQRNIPGELPAYLFYTSGSTGKPKGIVGKLSSLDHFVEWETKTFGLDSSCRISQFTTPTFDAYLRDVLTPLSVGGTLCIPPDRPTIMGADALWDWIENKGISLIHCVPSLFSALLEGNWKGKELQALSKFFWQVKHYLWAMPRIGFPIGAIA